MTAFQATAYQNNAFQIDSVVLSSPGGGYFGNFWPINPPPLPDLRHRREEEELLIILSLLEIK